MQVRVKLPDEPLIEFSAFCVTLAEAKFPTRVEHFKGIECIVGKTVRHELPMRQPVGDEKWSISSGLQSVLLSDDGRTLDQLARAVPESATRAESSFASGQAPHREVVELSLPYKLDKADRRTLQAILLDLPTLAYPISDADEAAFFDAYCKRTDRPAWKPDLVTASWMDGRKREYMDALEEHQKALREDHARGRIRAVSAAHVPVVVLTVGSFISRRQAIAYLESCGYVLDNGGECILTPVEQPPLSKSSEAAETTGPVKPVLIADAPSSSNHTSEEIEHEHSSQPEVSTSVQPLSVPVVSTWQVTGKVIRLPRVKELTGLKHSSIYNRMDRRSKYYDPTFPACFSLSTTGKGAVGWDEEAVRAWVASQASKAHG